jgi:surface protein
MIILYSYKYIFTYTYMMTLKQINIIKILNNFISNDISNRIISYMDEKIKNNNDFQKAITLWFCDNDKCIEQYGHISSWDTHNVTFMQGLFQYKCNFNDDISGWDTSNVISMSSMFYKSKNFARDISNWDTSKVTNMSEMFSYAKKINCNIGKWDVSNVINMEKMLYGANNLVCDLSSWNISNVSNMRCIFHFDDIKNNEMVIKYFNK